MGHSPQTSGPGSATSSRPWLGYAFLGAVAAGAALAVSELVAGFSPSAPSLVRTIGQRVIDNTPVPIVDWAIAMFGTNDKLVLVIGIVLVALGIGAFLGLLVRGRPGMAAAGFVVFGAVGFVAGLTDPQAGAVLTLVAATAAAGVGIGVLLGLRALLQGSARPVSGAVVGSRRAFLAASAATVIVSVGEVFLGRYLGSRTQSAAVGREQLILPTAPPSPAPSADPSVEGASDITAGSVPEFLPTETTVPEFLPTETTVPEFLPTEPDEAAGTTESAETASTTQPAGTETTQAAETTTTQPASTETTQAPETTTTQPATTEAVAPETTTTTQPATTETTRAPETTTTTQPATTEATRAPETTTTTQVPETTTTQVPETTPTTQAPETTPRRYPRPPPRRYPRPPPLSHPRPPPRSHPPGRRFRVWRIRLVPR